MKNARALADRYGFSQTLLELAQGNAPEDDIKL